MEMHCWDKSYNSDVFSMKGGGGENLKGLEREWFITIDQFTTIV